MVSSLSLLFADTTAAGAESIPSDLVRYGLIFLLFFLAFVPAFVIGNLLAGAVRMKDYGWKIGLILCTLTCSAVIIAPKPSYLGVGWPPKLGIDLNGGAILVYKVNLEDQVSLRDVVDAVVRRINPDGLKEILVRPFGSDHVEIIVPEVDTIEVNRIKRSIEQAGQLEFMITADKRPDHEYVVAKAKAQAESPDPKIALDKKVYGDDGKQIGLWVQVARDKESDGGKFKVHLGNWTIRNPKTGEIIDEAAMKEDLPLEDKLKNRGIQELQVLMLVNPPHQLVTGGDLNSINADFDPQTLSPKVDFTLRSGDAARRMGVLTGENLSDPKNESLSRHLGIVLDGALLSAPSIRGMIQDSGQITGRFSQEEVESLVGILRSGKLPATLDKEPVRDDTIDPTLGMDTIIQGSYAIGISFAAVMLFMLVYYRFSGVVACLSLMINLVLTVACMVLIKAPFTLPGLAGMVLTVGMAVDANVLIFERMREELAKGAALRMTIRNGFDRAFTTIVDSNLTTVITAVILYVIGTDQVKGFAVTLTLGILISMFTAIFCSRVIFDIAERNRWITQLNMLKICEATNFDFMRHWKKFSAISVVIIVIGLVATVIRGKGMFDIDFNGGTSVEPVLKEKATTDEIRTLVAETFDREKIQFSLTGIHRGGSQSELDGKVYKIDTSLQKVDQLRDKLKAAFTKDGKLLLANYSMSFDTPKPVVLKATAEKKTEEKPAAEKPAAEEKKAEPTAEKPTTDKPATEEKKTEPAADKPTADKPAADKPAAEEKKPEPAADKPASTEEKKPAADKGSNLSLRTSGLLALAEDAADAVKKLEEKASATDAAPASEKKDEKKADEKKSADAKPEEKKPEEKPAAPAEPAKPAVESAPKADTKPAANPEPAAEATTPAAPAEGNADAKNTKPAAAAPSAVTVMESQLKFDYAIAAQTLAELVEKIASDLKIPQPTPRLLRNGAIETSARAYKEWTLQLSVSEADAQAILSRIQTELRETPVFLSSSEIGGAVATSAQSSAIYAILASLIGIVLYIWVRFQRVIWGLAAVLALVHDVLMMLAAIACSLWLAPILGFLQVEEFKINLVIVAAFLTLVGYSINDTIVVFDRIREVRGKSPNVTAEMINLSINQTLSRTILTALTTFMVVIVLYFMGGPSIHGFAFSLVVGVFVGTYSSVFIAAPVMLWMAEPPANSPQSAAAGKGKKAPVGER